MNKTREIRITPATGVDGKMSYIIETFAAEQVWTAATVEELLTILTKESLPLLGKE